MLAETHTTMLHTLFARWILNLKKWTEAKDTLVELLAWNKHASQQYGCMGLQCMWRIVGYQDRKRKYVPVVTSCDHFVSWFLQLDPDEKYLNGFESTRKKVLDTCRAAWPCCCAILEFVQACKSTTRVFLCENSCFQIAHPMTRPRSSLEHLSASQRQLLSLVWRDRSYGGGLPKSATRKEPWARALSPVNPYRVGQIALQSVPFKSACCIRNQDTKKSTPNGTRTLICLVALLERFIRMNDRARLWMIRFPFVPLSESGLTFPHQNPMKHSS